MSEINGIAKLTDTPYVNLFHIKGVNKKSGEVNYYVASRAKEQEDLKLITRQNKADGVVIYSLYGEQRDKVVLVRQFRYTIDDYIYEFPAGLIDGDEDFHDAAVRELKEETGLLFTPLEVDESYERPYYTTIGMSDEACATVYGYADGEVSADYLEDDEEIQVVIADKTEVQRILKEENVAIMCSYMLMHFLADDEAFGFIKIKRKENGYGKERRSR